MDASFADILAGTAVAVLSRPAVVPEAGKVPGLIVFGDATNDPNINSHYVVDSVTLNSAVPEPGAMILAGTGALGLLRRRR